MTPQQLRNSILQLAIEGKIVEQRPEEGTGEELYQLIQEEKQELIKSGKLKKQKDLPEIIDDEIPFEIPTSWKWVKLGSVINYFMGKTPPRAEPEWWGSDTPWVSISDMSEYGFIKRSKESVSVKAINEKFARISKSGTLLMSFKLTVGRTSILDMDAVHNEAIISILPYVDLNNSFRDYLFYFLPTIVQWGDYKNAIKGKTLNSKSISNLYIPLPPISEQKRIVEKITNMLPMTDKYEKLWLRLNELNKKFPEELQKSILQEAIQGKLCEQKANDGSAQELIEKILLEKERLIEIGQIKKQKDLPPIQEDEIPFDIPENWEWVRLGSIGETNVGLTYKPIEVSNLGTIVLRSNNIQDGVLVYTDIVKVSKEIPRSKMCHIGDIIICARNGSKRLVGKAALIDIEGMSFGAFMAVYRSICNPYILKYINSVQFRKIMLPEVGTTTINQITQESLRKCVIPMPPLTEQGRIIKKVDKIMALINCSKKMFLK